MAITATRTHRRTAIGAVAAALLLAGCSLGGGSSEPAATTGADGKACAEGGSVTVISHESFVLSDDLKKQFQDTTGCELKLTTAGDTGALTNRLVLTKSSPVADAVYGIDNTFSGRAVAEGILEPYEPTLPEGAADHRLEGEGAKVLAPIDFGDVCVNIDKVWFDKKGLTPPETLDDLTKSEYKDLFVTPGAPTSSPGLAFMLATIAEKGDDWEQYWRDLKANGVKITSGWSDAYNVDFSAGEGKGDRPIVLSYASSPPFTIPEGKEEPTTEALLDTCFRQVEYAGVIKGTKNEAGAKAFVDFMLSDDVQATIPDAMYMFPVSRDVELPKIWAKWARTPFSPYGIDPERVASERDTWLKEWSAITS